MAKSAKLFGHAHDCAAGARIRGDFDSARPDGLAEDCQVGFRHFVRAERQAVGDVRTRSSGHEAFDDAVLERVEADHYQSAARPKDTKRLRER